MTMEKDPWLQAALRHAPDHDVAAPEAVRDTILAAARAATRRAQPAPPRRGGAWRAWWAWPPTTPGRLGYSGAFVALLVVGLWGADRLQQPAVPGVSAEALVLQAPASAAPAATTAPMIAPIMADTTASPPARRREATHDAPPRPAAAPLAKAEPTRPAAPTQPAVAAPASPALAEVYAPSVAAAPPPEVVANKRAGVVSAAALGAAQASSPTVPVAPPSLAMGLQPLPAAHPMAPASGPQTDAGDPLAQLRQAWALQPDLAWQTATGLPGHQGPAQQAWLARLQQALSGPWQAATRPAGPATLQWPGDSGAQLWLSAEGQVWLAWAGQLHTAPLPAAQAQALLDQLAGWRADVH